jgi:uncharacterized membrane protein YphA (DoxX/SURF4 family)
MLTRENPGFWIAFLRIAVGAAWLLGGLLKVLDPHYASGVLQPLLANWALRGNDAIGAFVTSALLPNVDVLAFALKALELLVGVSLVLGIFTRLGAFCGFAIVAAGWVFQHGFDSAAGYGNSTFIVLVTMLFLIFAPASRVFAADRLMMRKIAAPPPPAAPTVGNSTA